MINKRKNCKYKWTHSKHNGSIAYLLRGEALYPTANSLGYGGTGEVSKEGVERMVEDLRKQ